MYYVKRRTTILREQEPGKRTVLYILSPSRQSSKNASFLFFLPSALYILCKCVHTEIYIILNSLLHNLKFMQKCGEIKFYFIAEAN